MESTLYDYESLRARISNAAPHPHCGVAQFAEATMAHRHTGTRTPSHGRKLLVSSRVNEGSEREEQKGEIFKTPASSQLNQAESRFPRDDAN